MMQKINNLKLKNGNSEGQALISLVFFTIIGMAIATAAIVATLSSTIASSKFQSGTLTFSEAESGAENAYLKLLRDPYYKGETMDINGATVIATVSGSINITISSKATSGTFSRIVEIKLSYASGRYVIQSWKEVF
jgi:hypothetical protein